LCPPSLICFAFTGPNICQPLGAEGAVCPANFYRSPCAAGLVCASKDPQTFTCQQPRWVGDGQPCSPLSNDVCLHGSCGDSTPTPNTCPSSIPEGQPCNSPSGVCDDGSMCTNGYCQNVDVLACTFGQ
jgi:hypothetical protein